MLNELGYGKPGHDLELDLVYNPLGASLAPPQEKLESAYKSELKGAYGIDFNRLFCLNNMPIKRFADYLQVMIGYDVFPFKRHFNMTHLNSCYYNMQYDDFQGIVCQLHMS